MASQTERSGGLIHGINVTPLVDVVLVLLIIMMVTAQYAASQSLPMELPKASTAESTEVPPLAIALDASGVIHLDGQRLSKEELRQRVHALGAGPKRSALIAADGKAQHRTVVGIIDLLRGEGITKLAINVAPEDLKP